MKIYFASHVLSTPKAGTQAAECKQLKEHVLATKVSKGKIKNKDNDKQDDKGKDQDMVVSHI